MNFSSTETGNFSRLDFPSERQGRFLGPFLGFFLATLFPSIALARFQQGSIKFQYDPLPMLKPNPPAINIYQTAATTWQPVTKVPIEQVEPTKESDLTVFRPPYPDLVSTIIDSPSDFIPLASDVHKVSVKRAASSRYHSSNRKFNRFDSRRRPPEYLDYDYDYPRLKYRKRNKGRRPVMLNYDYDDDYDFGRGSNRRKHNKRRNNNKNRRDPDYYSDEDYDSDIEPVVLRPRQQITTTAINTIDTTVSTTTSTTTTTTPSTTFITNGTTSGSTNIPGTTISPSSTTISGYGPYSGNENISITYGPPSVMKPVYGVPGYSEWAPSVPLNTGYASPSGGTFSSLGTSYLKPYASPVYVPPSTSYGIPEQSYPVSQGPTSRVNSFQSYQLPFTSWYGGNPSHGEIVKRVQHIIKN
ncbi:hypothetical protein ABEB36_011511 [Hypothenemus hampei]|uniref:Uncharacterized protein n=1 Tax=Hypothenemus hampei TaxID=57062 RepID=A0ABD1EFP6_HYPHA